MILVKALCWAIVTLFGLGVAAASSALGSELHAYGASIGRKLIRSASRWHPEIERQDFIDEMTEIMARHEDDGKKVTAAKLGLSEWVDGALCAVLRGDRLIVGGLNGLVTVAIGAGGLLLVGRHGLDRGGVYLVLAMALHQGVYTGVAFGNSYKNNRLLAGASLCGIAYALAVVAVYRAFELPPPSSGFPLTVVFWLALWNLNWKAGSRRILDLVGR